jgi:hypothetical protein
MVALLSLFVFGASARASIIQPALPEFNIEEQADAGAGASNTAPGNSSREAPVEQVVTAFVIQHALGGIGGSTSGTTSSSSTGSGYTSTAALRTATDFSFADLALAGWLAGEHRFSLPAPAGNDLLRPPQAV